MVSQKLLVEEKNVSPSLCQGNKTSHVHTWSIEAPLRCLRSRMELTPLPHHKSCLMLTSLRLHLPCSSDGKESACNAGDLGLIPGLGRSSGEGNGNPLQYSCLENSMGRGVAGSQRVTNWVTKITTATPLKCQMKWSGTEEWSTQAI